MAWTGTMPLNDIRGIIEYCRDTAPHCESMTRVIGSRGIGCDPDRAEYQFHRVLSAAGKADVRKDGKRYCQGVSMIISFDQSELSWDKPDDVQKGLDIAERTVTAVYEREAESQARAAARRKAEREGRDVDEHEWEQYLPTYRRTPTAAIYAHADGEHNCLHCHCIVLGVDTETGKSLSTVPIKILHTVADDEILAAGIEPSMDDSAYAPEAVHKSKTSVDKVHMRDSYFAYLREKINFIADHCDSYEQCVRMFDSYGIELRTRKDRSIISYKYHDVHGVEHRIRVDNLGDDYSTEGLRTRIGNRVMKGRADDAEKQLSQVKAASSAEANRLTAASAQLDVVNSSLEKQRKELEETNRKIAAAAAKKLEAEKYVQQAAAAQSKTTILRNVMQLSPRAIGIVERQDPRLAKLHEDYLAELFTYLAGMWSKGRKPGNPELDKAAETCSRMAVRLGSILAAVREVMGKHHDDVPDVDIPTIPDRTHGNGRQAG